MQFVCILILDSWHNTLIITLSKLDPCSKYSCFGAPHRAIQFPNNFATVIASILFGRTALHHVHIPRELLPLS
uniref:Secreted protein n=1 Tax=Schistosoma mansoni TaxID=6183 RepID=A0A5K4F637_SCHMA